MVEVKTSSVESEARSRPEQRKVQDQHHKNMSKTKTLKYSKPRNSSGLGPDLDLNDLVGPQHWCLRKVTDLSNFLEQIIGIYCICLLPLCPSAQRSLSCDLPHMVGPCDQWTSRYYYDRSASQCVHFWYGGCNGNSNNFASEEECQKMCLRSELSQRDQAHVLQHSGHRFPARINLSSSGATHGHRAHRLAHNAMQQSSPAAR